MAALSRTALARCKPAKAALTSARTIHGPAIPTNEELYDEVAQYPEIPRFRTEDEKSEAEVKAKVKAMKTVEEKKYYVNLPKYFGWRAWLLDTSDVAPASLPATQFVTNTTVVEGLPESYNSLKGKSEELAESLAPAVKSALSFVALRYEHGPDLANDKVPYHEHFYTDPDTTANAIRRNATVVEAVHRLLAAGAGMNSVDHLRTASNDKMPRNEAFWFRGPMDPDRAQYVGRRHIVEKEKKRTLPPSRTRKTKEWAEEKKDHAFQIQCKHIHAQLRTVKALPPFLPMTDELVTSGHVPQFDYLPNQAGWGRVRRHGTNFNGTWTGTETEFSHLVVADNYQKHRPHTHTAHQEGSDHNERPDTLLNKAILQGFAMTYAQACNQGFSPFNDPTTPFVGQVMLTDGKRWKLSAYQLNKMALQGISETNEEMLRNVCWHQPEQTLYSDIDPESGEVSGFDLDVLAGIVRMYLLEPTVARVENEGYLDQDKSHVHKLKNRYNREMFTANFKHMMANRPRERTRDYGYIQWHQRLFQINHPEILHSYGDREPTWFRRAVLDPRGREHWHPEYRWYDNNPGPFVPNKFKTIQKNGKKGTGSKIGKPYAIKVTAPIPKDDD